MRNFLTKERLLWILALCFVFIYFRAHSKSIECRHSVKHTKVTPVMVVKKAHNNRTYSDNIGHIDSIFCYRCKTLLQINKILILEKS